MSKPHSGTVSCCYVLVNQFRSIGMAETEDPLIPNFLTFKGSFRYIYSDKERDKKYGSKPERFENEPARIRTTLTPITSLLTSLALLSCLGNHDKRVNSKVIRQMRAWMGPAPRSLKP